MTAFLGLILLASFAGTKGKAHITHDIATLKTELELVIAALRKIRWK